MLSLCPGANGEPICCSTGENYIKTTNGCGNYGSYKKIGRTTSRLPSASAQSHSNPSQRGHVLREFLPGRALRTRTHCHPLGPFLLHGGTPPVTTAAIDGGGDEDGGKCAGWSEMPSESSPAMGVCAHTVVRVFV